MKILLIGDEGQTATTLQLEQAFRLAVFPILDYIKEMAIMRPNAVELFGIKMAKKLNIPYIGFLDDAEAAAMYADRIVYIRSPGKDKPSVITEGEFLHKPIHTFSLELEAA